ncbi:MAG: transcriptional regulator NrdR [Microgenomates group bacterium]|nr:transcriptional regulator NrdR [Microgenomates group bacterium]
MRCLFCGNPDTDVIETRLSDDGNVIRRRRQCPRCQKRFTTYEKVEDLPILVIKRDGRRERFDREKLKKGLLKAVEKTTVNAEQVEKIVNQVEGEIKQMDKEEVESQAIGKLVAKKLKTLDKIAYIRFASVFQRFVDLEDFERELKKLL